MFMSIRSFLFCNACNPRGIRNPEQRRDQKRGKSKSGRRISDARSWFEGSLEEAVDNSDWVILPGGHHICPDCAARGLKADAVDGEQKLVVRTFVFCDSCNPQGFRFVETRRDKDRSGPTGRRISDGRSWLDASSEEVVLEKKWIITGQGKHYCPSCVKRIPALTTGMV